MSVFIKKDLENNLIVKYAGKLDIDSSAEYGMAINDAIDDADSINALILDFSEITYIASIGLRVLIELYQKLNKTSEIRVIKAQPQVLDVIKMTGFDKFLKIFN